MPADGTEMSQEQASFMQGLEKDAEDRHQRRLKKQAEAQVLKGQGNVAFKGENFTEAIRLYTEVSCNPRPATRNLQPATCNRQPATGNRQPATRDPRSPPGMSTICL